MRIKRLSFSKVEFDDLQVCGKRHQFSERWSFHQNLSISILSFGPYCLHWLIRGKSVPICFDPIIFDGYIDEHATVCGKTTKSIGRRHAKQRKNNKRHDPMIYTHNMQNEDVWKIAMKKHRKILTPHCSVSPNICYSIDKAVPHHLRDGVRCSNTLLMFT